MKMENENTEAATPESMPEYLDRLSSDQSVADGAEIEAGLTGAAAEIRRLENRVTYLQAASDIANQQLGNLAEAILVVISEELEAKIEETIDSKISDALDDYDPTQHYDFDDAVDRRVSESSIDDIVREMLDNASVSISV